MLGLTSYKFLQLRKDAGAPTAPAGGLTGVGRHALLAVLRQLGVLREDHHQYDFLQAMAFFAEHCMLEADSAWCELQQRPGPEHTLQVLQRRFSLPLLCAVQVGRYLELTDSGLFSGRACDALGPRALEMASYVFPSEKHPAQQDCHLWRAYVRKLMTHVNADLQAKAAQLLGEEDATFVLAYNFPYVRPHFWSHASLMEHMLCELRKLLFAASRGHKGRGEGTPNTRSLGRPALLACWRSCSCM